MEIFRPVNFYISNLDCKHVYKHKAIEFFDQNFQLKF